MKGCEWVLVATAVAAASPGGASADGRGREVFVAEKCDTCHTVPAAGITAKVQVDKMRGPDLPLAQWPSDDWLGRYLRQQEKTEGVLHKKKFSGSDDDLAALLAWLHGLAEGH